MDSEVKDKANKCESEETSADSPAVNKNNVLNDSAKKLLITNTNESGDKMEVDGDKDSSPSKFSERKNGISDECSTKENQNDDIKTNKEKATSSNEQNNSSDIDVVQNSVNSEETTNVTSSDEKCNSDIEEKDKTEKESESETKSNENHKDNISSDLTSESQKPMDVDTSDVKNTKSSEKSSLSPESSEKVDVRPNDKASNNSTEAKETDKTSGENTEKAESSKNEEKSLNAEAPAEIDNTKGSKGKETEIPATENKTSSGKKEEESKTAASGKKEEESKTAASGKKEEESKTGSGKKEEEKEEKTKKKKSKTCEECGVKKGLKFQVLFKGKTRFLCSDTCFKNFKTKQMQSKASSEAASEPPAPSEQASVKCICQKDIPAAEGYYPVIGDAKPLCSEECMKKYVGENIPVKSCSQCEKIIENSQNPDALTWETMAFCNEDCLGKYQSYLGSHCTCCQSPVPQSSLGKYSVCFGADIRQFCSCNCLDEFKKNLKVCSFCQTDLSAGVDSFLAPVGDKGQFKDFCSQNCMERYEIMNNITKSAPQTQICSHCKKQGTFKIQVKLENEAFSLCGDMCVAGFRCSRKIKDRMCDTCFNFFTTFSEKDFSFKFDGSFKQFCTKACMTLFVLSHRRIVACVSCKVKKYNFDMIEKTDLLGQVQIFCSLNCLSLYRVSVNATSSKCVRCDNCTKNLPAQYHLTMSDGSVRNFCTYNCVILFQKQYTNVCTLTTASATRQTTAATATSKTAPSISTPVISNVVSLAAAPRSVAPTLIKVPTRQPMQPVAIIGSKPASSTITSPASVGTVTNASGQQVVREVIVKPPAPKSQKNKSVACKPIMQHKGINVKPQPCHKAVQTDDSPRPIILPVPVPVYIPTPVHLFSRPVPCPVPFPVPIPVPILIPITKDSANQDQIPSFARSFFMMSEKGSGDGSRKDISKDSSNFLREKDKYDQEPDQTLRTDEPSSSASDECNDANDYEEDEYVFKDNKHHRHGKRHSSHHKSKSHKKHKSDDGANDESRNQTAVPAEENQNSVVQNDHADPVPRLKVP